jgi:hypothetical protein
VSWRDIYSCCISVEASDFTHPVPVGDDYEDREIEGLDDLVSTAAELRFTLDYPFDAPYEGRVQAYGDGITLRQVIIAIRQGFRVMYAGASAEDIPGLANKKVEGTYGRAFHVIGDLVIESLAVSDESGTLDVGIGS